jgi:hypothetical protein
MTVHCKQHAEAVERELGADLTAVATIRAILRDDEVALNDVLRGIACPGCVLVALARLVAALLNVSGQETGISAERILDEFITSRIDGLNESR